MPPDTAQTASPHGSGNIVVQIVGERNAVTIAGATALRLREYLGDAFVSAPANAERAGEPGYTATGRRETRILAPTNRASLPLQGRADLLGRLRDWLATPDALSVHALIGGGGRGKTRLAVELTAEARAQGWTAGFARQEELTIFRGTGCRTARDAKTLVVVDYAAAKAAEITAWLRALVHEAEAPDRPRLRILLLERLGGEGVAWWREVFGAPGPEGEAVADLLAPGAPLTVGPLADPAERHAVFAAAFRQARDTAPPPRDPALDDALSRASLGGEPLFLAMFGLTAARQGLDAAKALPADRIALDLAAQELERIGRVWRAHGLTVGRDRPLHAHLAAVAVLCEGLGEDAAHAAIARESAALNQAIPAGATEPARAALHAALPGEAGGIAAIQPDILAEAAMILAWRPLPDGGVEAVRRAAAAPGQREAVARTVIRACQDFLIRGQKAPLAWLDALRADAADLETLMRLADAMPQASLELRETALDLTRVIADAIRALPEELGEERASPLAQWLNNLSNRLSDLGRREAALAAIEEAVSVLRALAAARPDAFLPDLASSLNNLSIQLANLGRREAALAAIEKAVPLYRALAAARPDAFLPEVAISLNTLSNRLSDLGRREAALAAIEEAVSVQRALAAARPDAFLPGLATSLNNLSAQLAKLGRREAALAVVEEAVSHYRALAATQPDAFLPDLAASLNNLSNSLANVGRREAALAAIAEAVSVRRALAAARPDAFVPGLATSFGARGRILAVGHPRGAARSFAEGVEALRPQFLALPQAFASLMGALCRDYIEACEAAGQEPDMALIAPIVAAFESLRGYDTASNEEG